jgi:hypothetical protein
LLKSTMLQLDARFSEKAYGAGSFSDFVEKLRNAGYVELGGGEGRYTIRRKTSGQPEAPPAQQPQEALPLLRDILETHRLELDSGAPADDLASWVREVNPDFDPVKYGFQEFAELLNYAQDKLLVRIEPEEEEGLIVFLGAEFYPPAPPEEPAEPASEEAVVDEPQPIVKGQPTAVPIDEPKPRKRTSRRRPSSKPAGARTTIHKGRPRKSRPAPPPPGVMV